MIYLKNTTSVQQVSIPVSKKISGMTGLDLILVSTIDRSWLRLSVNPELSGSGQYYIISVTLPAMEGGTYEYDFGRTMLGTGRQTLSKGICMVGDFENADYQYNIHTEYEQYTGE